MWNFLRVSACRRRTSGRNARLLLCSALAVAAALSPAAQAAPVASVTTLTLSATPVASPAPVTLTASVTAGGSAVAAGSVTFCDASALYCEDAAVIGNAQLIAGVAQFKLIPSIGTHTYKAMFHATATAAASTSTVQMLTVNGLYPTTTAIAASGNPDGYTLTATVVGYANHPPVLAGTVSFQDTTNGNFVIGTAPLGAPTYAESFTQASGSPIHVGNQPSAAGIGDFNGDGKPDVAVMNAYDNSINILLGNGDGTFSTTAPLIEGVGTADCIYQDQPSNCSIAVGDINHDGKADLAVTSGGDNTVIVLLGNGDGTFAPASGSPITVGTFPEAVKIADVNNDGLLDMVIANAKDNTVSILLGNGDGTFQAAAGSPVAVGGFPFFLAVADFNGDGAADIAATNEDDSTVTILLGSGTGTFTEATGSPISSLYNPGPVVAADFNGDGFYDLAVGNFTPVNANASGNVVILLGNHDGTFTPAPTSPLAVGVDPFALAIADFNGDGKTDLAVDNYGQIDKPETQTLSILLGDGKGGFTQLGTPIPLGDSPNDLGVADFNGDGAPDFAIPNVADFNATILLNQFTQTETATVSNITIAGTGTHYVDAMYPGHTFFAPSTSTTVPLQGKVVPTTLALTASPVEQMITMPVTFTAQLTAISPEAPSAQPTGTVTFYDLSLGGVSLGTAPMGANGQAVFTTTAIGPGTHVITASYAGDASFLSSASGNVSVQIDELLMTRLGKNNSNILPGTTVVYTLQVTPQVASTFLYTVSFTATGLPAGASATFSPVTLSAGGKIAQVKMSVKTSASARNEPPSMPFGRLPLALGLLLPLCGTKAARRRLRQWPRGLGLMLLAVLGLAAAASLSGCSGAGLFAAKKVPYTITVTATEGTVQRTTQVPLAIY